MPTDKLYKVTCQGMTTQITGPAHGVAFVVAPDPGQAYEKVRKWLDQKDLGFNKERELASIELIAEEADYPDCGYRLYL